jgi:hypothetical protein
MRWADQADLTSGFLELVKRALGLSEPVSDTHTAGARHARRELLSLLGASGPTSEPCPCDRCPQAAMCCDLQLACRAFARFVRGVRWKDAARKPTHERYLKVFSSES